jgi:hypothetical protein
MSNTATKIIEIATQVVEDEAKFAKGNNSAGTRARAGYQEIKKLCQAGRVDIQSAKNAEKAA